MTVKPQRGSPYADLQFGQLISRALNQNSFKAPLDIAVYHSHIKSRLLTGDVSKVMISRLADLRYASEQVPHLLLAVPCKP